MRLFSLPSGSVDRRTRAWLLTQPFDLAFGAVVVVVNPSITIKGARTTLTIKGARTTLTIKGARTGAI